MKYSQINPTKVWGILLLIVIVFISGCDVYELLHDDNPKESAGKPITTTDAIIPESLKSPIPADVVIALEDGHFEIPELKQGESVTILVSFPERKPLQEYCINLTQDWSWCSYAESQEHFERILSMYEFSEVTFGKVDEPAIGSSTEPFSVTEVESVKPQEVSADSSQS